MIYASILAAVSGAADDADAVAIAADLAARHAASLKVLTAFPIMDSSWSYWAGSPAAAARLAPMLAQMKQDRERRTLAMAEHEAGRFGLARKAGAAGTWAMAEPAATPWLGLVEQLPLSDLLVVAQSVAAEDGPWTGFLADALMAARAAVLIARGGVSAFGRPAAVAWDGSLQAGRAVKAALPLLKDASEVVILQDADGLDPAAGASTDPERVIEYLGHHGVGPMSIVSLTGREEGAALLRAAADVKAALLVAGGFGHTRLREAIFGGVTRTFLRSADGPHLLLAH